MYKIRTNYFTRPWIWVKTAVLVSIILFGLFLWSAADYGGDYSWVGFPIGIFLIMAIVLAPTDDVAVDDQYFYHLRTSLFPRLSKIRKYDISTMKNIRSGGMLTQSMDVLEYFSFRGGSRNTIEITFTDDSYQSLDVAIYREDLKKITAVVSEMIK